MRPLDKIELLEMIGAELQGRMTFDDIAVYLRSHGVDLSPAEDRSYNSKRVYAKDILAEAGDDKLLEIAAELELGHGFGAPSIKPPSFWKPGYFRLFLSHLSSFKKQTAILQRALEAFGISAFVAHEDIEPSLEWQREIEGALHTMDALCPLLMPGFKESAWCDQEVGFAVARQLPVIPVRKGLDPYGFIGKYQGIQALGKTIGEVAKEIFQALAISPDTKSKLMKALAFACGQAPSSEQAAPMLESLSGVSGIPIEALQVLKQEVEGNSALLEDTEFLGHVNALLAQYDLEAAGVKEEAPATEIDDIPF